MVWDEGESNNDADILSSYNEIIEENNETTIVHDDSRDVCKDDNAHVVRGVNSDPSSDLFHEEYVSHILTYAHNLENQLKVNVDQIMASMRHYDDTKALVEIYCWRIAMTHHSLGGKPSLANFQILKEALVEMKYNYIHLLSDRDHLLMLVEIYHDVLEGKGEEVDRLIHELETTQESLKSTQMALQESVLQVE